VAGKNWIARRALSKKACRPRCAVCGGEFGIPTLYLNALWLGKLISDREYEEELRFVGFSPSEKDPTICLGCEQVYWGRQGTAKGRALQSPSFSGDLVECWKRIVVEETKTILEKWREENEKRVPLTQC
jgi:hypothetical protein